MGRVYYSGVQISGLTWFYEGAVVSVRVNIDTGEIWFWLNGVPAVNHPVKNDLSWPEVFAAVNTRDGGQWTANFGATPFVFLPSLPPTTILGFGPPA